MAKFAVLYGGTFMSEKNKETNEFIIGRNPLMEALKSGRELNQIFVARGERTGSIGRILSLAKEKGIPIKEVDAKNWIIWQTAVCIKA